MSSSGGDCNQLPHWVMNIMKQEPVRTRTQFELEILKLHEEIAGLQNQIEAHIAQLREDVEKWRCIDKLGHPHEPRAKP